jgi:hypothetical protein
MFETLIGLFFRYLIPVLIGSIVVSVFLASRSALGKRVGAAKLGVSGYLLLLAFFCWLVAASSSSSLDSMGYSILPLTLATLPWSFLVTWLLDQLPASELSHLGGQVFYALVMVVVGGGMNCLIFLRLFGTARRSGPHPKTAA